MGRLHRAPARAARRLRPPRQCRGARRGSRAARATESLSLASAVSQDRLQLLSDGRVLLALKTAWADGTRQLLFEPLELLEKLAALTPRPRINLVLYHGVLAPNARWRARVVAHRPVPAATSLPASPSGDDTTAKPTPRHWSWARLMQRAFEIDVLACPRCGGRLRLIATVEDPRAIREVLDALAFSTEAVERAPPRQSVDAIRPTAVCA